VRHGAVLSREAAGLGAYGPWAVVDGDGALLAVYEARAGATAKPAVVVADQDPPG
jgi:hypothetical protein